jgi:hypothetical protein
MPIIVCRKCNRNPEKHNFRHSFEPYELEFTPGGALVVDFDHATSELVSQKCVVEQCGRDAILHGPGSVIAHPYTPSTVRVRTISLYEKMNGLTFKGDTREPVVEERNGVVGDVLRVVNDYDRVLYSRVIGK